MALAFDGATKIITLDDASVSAAEIWSRWADWHSEADNAKWPLAFRQVGGDDLGSGLSIPPYYFLLNGWRVRPMEANHSLVITGNLFVDGGGVPVVNTIGAFNVSAQYTVPVQAQGIATGGSTGPTASEIAAAVLAAAALAPILSDIRKVNNLPIDGAGTEADPFGPV
jgi:cephalosporin-C deacetylase-like acetyl esterase